MVVVMQKKRRMKSLILSGSRRLAQLFGNALSTQLAPLFNRNPLLHRWFCTESYCSGYGGWNVHTSAHCHCQIKISVRSKKVETIEKMVDTAAREWFSCA